MIVPWNYPIFLSFGPLTGAIAAGNRAMVKMSENARVDSRSFRIISADFEVIHALDRFEDVGGGFEGVHRAVIVLLYILRR